MGEGSGNAVGEADLRHVGEERRPRGGADPGWNPQWRAFDGDVGVRDLVAQGGEDCVDVLGLAHGLGAIQRRIGGGNEGARDLLDMDEADPAGEADGRGPSLEGGPQRDVGPAAMPLDSPGP